MKGMGRRDEAFQVSRTASGPQESHTASVQAILSAVERATHDDVDVEATKAFAVVASAKAGGVTTA